MYVCWRNYKYLTVQPALSTIPRLFVSIFYVLKFHLVHVHALSTTGDEVGAQLNEHLRNTPLTNLKNSKLQLCIRILYCLALLLKMLPVIFSLAFLFVKLIWKQPKTGKMCVSLVLTKTRNHLERFLQRPETTFNEQETT